MISKNFKILLALIFAALIFSPLKGEDKIDIWKNKKKNGNIENKQSNTVTKKMISNQIWLSQLRQIKTFSLLMEQ